MSSFGTTTVPMNGVVLLWKSTRSMLELILKTIRVFADCLQISAFEICLCASHHFIMGARSNLSPDKRALIVTLSEAGFFKRWTAADLRYNQAAVGDAIRRFREMCSDNDRPHSRRPPAQDRFLALIACRHRFRTTPLLKGQWRHTLRLVR